MIRHVFKFRKTKLKVRRKRLLILPLLLRALTSMPLHLHIPDKKTGGHSIAPKTASANAANAKVRNRQMIGRPIIL